MQPHCRPRSSLRSVATLVLAAFMLGGLAERAAAQTDAIMSPGDTIVTGFPGVTTPTPPFPSGNAIDETFIDVNGPSMQIQRPQPDGPPAGQLIASPTIFSAPAGTVGEVFPITLDDQPAPDIYLGATSAFGIQIVAPDSDGNGLPQRITHGQPDATFMDGQWGQGGAPGSIYRVDGTTGDITLFTTIGANAGPGLGDIVYDRASHQFFVSDLDTGLIYRLDSTGLIVDTFDHGVNGRPAAGLAAVADDNSTMDITSPAFDSENPASWGFTQPERRVGGMALHGGRLYYAVAKPLQVWSIGINLDGSFANDARWELDVTGLASDNPITDMIFDGQGRMILAQRGEQRGSYDYTVFADPLKSSVVRYTREVPDDPSTPSTWVEVPDEYAIGFRPDGRNTDGGVALGYDFDSQGLPRQGVCNEYLWTTGESLRDNPALAAQLAAGGPATVDGLQGNHISLVRPANDPPFQSYFTDYDNQFDHPEYQGHMGDVEVAEPCQGGYSYIPPYFPPPGYTPPPAGGFNLRLDKVADPKTCDVTATGFNCQYTIRVTNTGPGFYWGPLQLIDWFPQNPAGAVVNFDPSPPWVCGNTGPSQYQCDYPDVPLWPGDSVDLHVSADLPAGTDLCNLTNVATLAWAPGWGDADPSDDAAFANALIPNSKCTPPPGDHTNLKIEKRGLPVCLDKGANWACLYAITVTNTGPGDYTGDIVVHDKLSVADPITWLPPQWTCTNPGPDHTCTFPGASLPDGGGGHLAATHSVGLLIGVLVPKAAQEQAQACTVSNQAEITKAPGGSPTNINPADDTSAVVESATPGPNCEPVGKRSDLSIEKRGLTCLVYLGHLSTTPGTAGTWACTFAITVHNNGPDDFTGALTVKDTFLGFTPLSPSPIFVPPVCASDGGGGYDCTTAGTIASGGTAGPLVVAVLVPDDGQTCDITNQAEITAPAGGSSQNTNPANDKAQGTLHIPSVKCAETQEIQLCPVQSRMPGGKCCPDGGSWNGRACSNGLQPLPPPPPPPSAKCPSGTHGTYPDCAKNACPKGTIGTYPNCAPIRKVCPPGTHGTYPDCAKNACPKGTIGTYPNCAPIRKVCPPGTHGIYPDCAKNVCPRGTFGIYPNCAKLPPIRKVCPPGTHGIYPDCAKNACPKGTFGIYPNCVRRPTTGPTLQINPNLKLNVPRTQPVIR